MHCTSYNMHKCIHYTTTWIIVHAYLDYIITYINVLYIFHVLNITCINALYNYIDNCSCIIGLYNYIQKCTIYSMYLIYHA